MMYRRIDFDGAKHHDESCPVCFEEFESEKPIVAHEGSGHLHPIHLKCAQDSISRFGSTCPSCRVEVTLRDRASPIPSAPFLAHEEPSYLPPRLTGIENDWVLEFFRQAHIPEEEPNNIVFSNFLTSRIDPPRDLFHDSENDLSFSKSHLYLALSAGLITYVACKTLSFYSASSSEMSSKEKFAFVYPFAVFFFELLALEAKKLTDSFHFEALLGCDLVLQIYQIYDDWIKKIPVKLDLYFRNFNVSLLDFFAGFRFFLLEFYKQISETYQVRQGLILLTYVTSIGLALLYHQTKNRPNSSDEYSMALVSALTTFCISYFYTEFKVDELISQSLED